MIVTLVAVSIQALISLFLILWTRNRVKNYLESELGLQNIHNEINSLIAEMDNSTNRNVTVLEDRLEKLKNSLTDADKKIVALDGRIANITSLISQSKSKTESGISIYDRKGKAQNHSEILNNEENDRTEIDFSINNSRKTNIEKNPQLVLQETEHHTQKETGEEIPFIKLKKDNGEESYSVKVLNLYKSGLSTDIIAAKTKTTIAEVNLVLSMNGEKDN